MEICGKCGREPWDGICPLLPSQGLIGILRPRHNADTRKNCGHPAIGESPLIIEAAERNKLFKSTSTLPKPYSHQTSV